MWHFGRKAKVPALPLPDGMKGKVAAPEILKGPHLIRRTEITVEREWSSSVTRMGEPIAPAEIVVERPKDDGRN